MEYVFTNSNLIPISNRKYLQELCKRKSKVHQEHMPQESALNFDQWETLSKNYNSIRVFVYKIRENNCHLRYFAEFMQTQKTYTTSIDKISTLTWILLAMSNQKYSDELNFSVTYSLRNISDLPLRLYGNWFIIKYWQVSWIRSSTLTRSCECYSLALKPTINREVLVTTTCLYRRRVP